MHPKAHTISFTKEGYEAVKKEQEELLKKRPEAIAELKRAREMGDLSENGAYKGAKMLVSHIDSRLRHLAHLLRFAKIIEAAPEGIVGLNSHVVVGDGKEERVFHIVGEHESNPLEGKISHKSPMGSQLMGKRVGQEIHIVVPKGTLVYTIKKISS